MANPEDFVASIDDRIRNLKSQLDSSKRYLVDDIMSDSVEWYGNLHENIIGLQSRIAELEMMREKFVMWCKSK